MSKSKQKGTAAETAVVNWLVGRGREYWVEYPCPTIKALDGEQ